MADLTLTFLHPTDGRKATVSMDPTMTAEEAIGQLLANNFMPPHQHGYQLAVKGGRDLLPAQSFAEAGVNDGDTIRVVPLTQAGRTRASARQ